MKDKLGQVLAVGDYVVYRQHTYLEIGRVKSLTKKRIVCQIVHPRWTHCSHQLDGTVVKIDQTNPLLSQWMLQGCK